MPDPKVYVTTCELIFPPDSELEPFAGNDSVTMFATVLGKQYNFTSGFATFWHVTKPPAQPSRCFIAYKVGEDKPLGYGFATDMSGLNIDNVPNIKRVYFFTLGMPFPNIKITPAAADPGK